MGRCERSSIVFEKPKSRASAAPFCGDEPIWESQCNQHPMRAGAGLADGVSFSRFRGTNPARASRLGSSAVAARRSCRDDRAHFGRAKPGSIIESMVWCHNTSTFGQIRRESRLVQRGPQRHRASSGVGRDTQPPIGGGDAARGRAARLRAAILAEQFPAKTTMESVHDMVNPEQRPSCGRVAGGAMARARRMDFAATFAPLNRHE
jgi:hypothetical protein